MYVYVINMHGRPLMPCSPRKARKLLESGKAAIAKRTPYTIRLLYGSAGYRQDITLGIDAGSRHVGMSACTKTKELYAEEMSPRNDVVKTLADRRQLRRGRRSRKTRYRAPRFNNRVHSKHNGWLAPSVEVKIQEHISAVKRIMGILPITLVRIETAEFDTQRLKAMLEGCPLPAGTDYQKGEMYDWYNVRQYVLYRDNYTCQCCGKSHSDKTPVKLHVHHLESRKTGGNAPNNLVTLCEACHKALHAGKAVVSKKRGRTMRDAAFMGIMRKTLLQRLRTELPVPVQEAYGYITKYHREQNSIPKSHTNDARCITGYPKAEPEGKCFLSKALRRHCRQIYKCTIKKGGVKERFQAEHVVRGFRLHDTVKYDGRLWYIAGLRRKGALVLKTLAGDMTERSPSKLAFVNINSGFVIQ